MASYFSFLCFMQAKQWTQLAAAEPEQLRPSSNTNVKGKMTMNSELKIMWKSGLVVHLKVQRTYLGINLRS